MAATVAEALELAVKGEPHAVLMDIRLPDGDGIEATGAIKDLRPATNVIVLTAGADPGALLRAADAGASGFLPKETRMAAILDAARRSTQGELAVAPSALQGLLAAGRRQAPAGSGLPGTLAEDGRRVLALMAEGMDLDAVAAELGATPDDCREAVRRAAAAVGARSPLQALLIATREGLLTPGDLTGRSRPGRPDRR